MVAIFVSYRRNDERERTEHLVDALAREFGARQVFFDVNRLEGGANFPRALRAALARSKVLLLLIGPKWSGPIGTQHASRLHDPRDWVRKEILLARRAKATIIPVVFEGAGALRDLSLPRELQWLQDRQAHELSHSHWKDDVRRLLSLIRRTVKLEGAQVPGRTVLRGTSSKARRAAALGSWRGEVNQRVGADHTPRGGKCVLELESRRGHIVGTGDFDFRFNRKSVQLKFDVSGSLWYDRYLKLDYKNANEDAIQFGSIILELNDEGAELAGRFLGYGSISRMIVDGEISLSKRASVRRHPSKRDSSNRRDGQ